MRKARKLSWAIIALCLLLAPVSARAQSAWNLEQGKSVTAMAMSPDGKLLAVGSSDTHVYLFDEAGKQVAVMKTGNVVTGVGFAGADRLLASSDDRNLYAFGLNGELLWKQDLKKRVEGVAPSADGSTAAVTVQNSSDLLLIDPSDGGTQGKASLGARAADVAAAPGGGYIAVGGKDQNVYLLDGNGNVLFKAGMNGTIGSVAVSDEGRVAAGLTSSTVVLLDRDGSKLREIAVLDSVKDVALTPDGDTIGAADYAGHFYLISSSGKTIWQTQVPAPATQLAFGAEGKTLYGGTENGGVYSYEVKNVVAGAESAAAQKRILLIAAAAAALLLIAAGLYLLKRYNRLSVFKRIWQAKWIYLSLSPAFILLIGFMYVPALSGLYHSLYEWNPGGRSTFVGLANFRRILSDDYVGKGIVNLGILIVTGLLKAIVPPLFVAELIYHLKSKRLQYYFRTAFVTSMIVPAVALLLIWQNLYDPNVGLINRFLEAVGLDGLTNSWLGDPKTAIWAIIFIGFPFVGILQLLVLYSGLIGIPDELIEAAKMDGARLPRIIRSIHLPLLAGQFKFLIILTLIGVIQDFNAILIVTGGGPMDSTYVPALQMYYAATKFDELGYASALGVSMFFVILVITVVNMKFLRSSQE
ncbi:ABC transporter permease subunit [Cohnella hashimotonis]|uniref:ABC transporter permease subunit n=1 Tax=Cohnella hashimotonis TaxID=2826895 RepID=A0ABT6T969_9BACL|nr:ABC transporter permease subunit [Cohnella hashimotonis]